MLESVIVATIMLSAIAFVATFESAPTSTSAATRTLLKQQAEDALAVLYDSPASNKDLGDNLLSQYLVECLQDSACTNLTAKLNRTLPIGSSYALYLSNGIDTYPVYVTKSPPGEAVTAKRLVEPKWSSTFTGPSMVTVNNVTDPLVLTSIPVFNSNVLTPGGSPLKIVVRGVKHSDGSQYTLEAEYATEAFDQAQKGIAPAVSLNFLVNRTYQERLQGAVPLAYTPGSYWDRYAETVFQPGVPPCACAGYPSNASLVYRLRIDEAAGVGVPAGTQITVNVPRGWNASGIGDAQDTRWHIIQNATDWNSTYTSSDVVAQLNQAISGTAEFQFYATYHGDLLNDYPFHAYLSKGADAQANMIVKADGWQSQTQTFAIPSVVASIPRPMGVDETTTWSLAVNIPYNPVANLVVSKTGVGSWVPEPPNANAQPAPGDPSQCVAGALAVYGPSKDPTAIFGVPNSVPGCAYGDTKISHDDTVATNTAILIKNITITSEDGAAIFKTVGFGTNPLKEGSWSIKDSGSSLYWETDNPSGYQSGHYSTTQGPLNLTFQVGGNGKAGATNQRQIVSPPATYETSKGRLVHQLSPGLYREPFLPDQTTGPHYNVKLKGYSTGITNVQTPLNHTYTSNPVYRATPLDGSNQYTDNALSPYHDSLYGSYVNVDKRTVTVGGQVLLTADVQSILYALAQAGQSAGVNLTFYPPWTGDKHVPIWRQSNLDSGLAAADVTKLVMLDVTSDGIKDPVIGTSTGRVLAYDATTGERTQGNTFVAPVSTTHNSGATVPAITALETIRLGNVDYLVVGTDGQSDVYVLDKNLNVVWTFVKPGQNVVAIDASTDITGDGRNDIVMTLADATTYVLTAAQGDPSLRAVHPPGWTSGQSEALYAGTGTPKIVVALAGMGLDGGPGFATSLVQKPGAGGTVNRNSPNPLQTVNLGLTLKAPAAGLELVDKTGALSSTFWGPAVTAARAVPHNGDASKTDVVAGSSSGYVYLLNGVRAANPVAGFLLSPSQKIIDGDVRDNAHAAMLMDDGGVYYTFDGWNIAQCMNCDPAAFYSNVNTALNSISMAGAGDIWGVGDGNVVYKTINLPDGTPQMVPVALANVAAGGTPVVPALAVHNFKSTQFTWGTGNGWMVGTPVVGTCGLVAPLDTLCTEAGVLHTPDGGSSWTVITNSDATNKLEKFPNGKVTATLLRVNFTTSAIGWIVGTGGTILRSTDSGTSFHGVDSGTTAEIRDISCAPDAPDLAHMTCLAVGADTNCVLANPTSCIVSGKRSVILKSTTGGASWTDISSLVDPTLTRDMNATAMYSATHAIVAGGNQVWETRDAGLHWTALPMGGKLGPVARLGVNADETGFGFGGNSTGEGYVYYFGDYKTKSQAQTTNVAGGAGLPATAVVDSVTVNAAITTATGTAVTVKISNDGGNTFYPATHVGTNTPQPVADATGVSVVLPDSAFTTDFTSLPAGKDVRVQFGFATDPATAESTGRVLSLDVRVNYHCTSSGAGGCVGSQSPTFSIGVKDPAYVDGAHTTSTWDTTMGQIRNPLAAKYWTSNVSGYVGDLQVGPSVTGHAPTDVWVGTGNILADNNPDYLAFTGGDPNAIVGSDNRVYLLDGLDGHVVATSAKLDGNVTSIRLVNTAGDARPEYVYVATVHTLNTGVNSGTVYALNATDLTPVPTTSPDASNAFVTRASNPTITGLGDEIVGGKPMMYYSTRASGASTGKATLSGAINTLRLSDLNYLTRRPDVRGTYIVTKVIPSDWLFGPYAVEVAVDWTDNVIDNSQGTPVARSVLQSARFYDYFVVAPPSSLSPPSPVYDVHLVTWMDDWR